MRLVGLMFQFHNLAALTDSGCHGLKATWAFRLAKQLLLLILLLATVCLHNNLDVHEKEVLYLFSAHSIVATVLDPETAKWPNRFPLAWSSRSSAGWVKCRQETGAWSWEELLLPCWVAGSVLPCIILFTSQNNPMRHVFTSPFCKWGSREIMMPGKAEPRLYMAFWRCCAACLLLLCVHVCVVFFCHHFTIQPLAG